MTTAPLHSPPSPMPWTKRKNDEEDRRPDADLTVGRQAADQERAQSHRDHGRDQHLLAAEPVAIMPDDRTADRPRDEADGIGRERRQCADEGIEAWEEQLVQNQRRRRA